MRRRQHPRQGHATIAAGDVDRHRADIAVAVALDRQAAGQSDVDAAQQHGIGRQIGEHRGLDAVDLGLDREAAAVARIDAAQGNVDRIAAAAEARIGRDDDARRVALQPPPRRGGHPGDPGLDVAQRQLRLLDLDRIELADQRLVVGLGQQLLDQQLDRLALRLGARIGEDAAHHAAFAVDLGLEGRPLDDDRGRQEYALEHVARIEGQRRAGHRGDHLILAVGEAQSGENQPKRLADPAPFQGDAVDLGLYVVARHVGRLGDPRLQEVEVDRARPSGAARPPRRARPGRGQRRPLRVQPPDRFA